MKICSRCRQPKKDFPKHKIRPDGLNPECKDCTSIKSKEVRIRRKWRVISHYTKGTMKCDCCRENRFEFLTIDHIDGGGSKHRKSIVIAKKDPIDMYGFVTKYGFPEGFRILCCNCNFSRGAYGYCPHNHPGIIEFPAYIDENRHPNKMNMIVARDIKQRLLTETVSSISRSLGLSRITIQDVKWGRTWKEV